MHIAEENSRPRAIPGPGGGVHPVRISDDDGLHGNAGVEGPRFEGDKAGPVGGCALRKNHHLWIKLRIN